MRPGAKFLHSVFEVAHVEFQTYDITKHRLLFSSGLLHQLLGISEEEYAKSSGNFYNDIVHPDDRPIVRQTMERISRAKAGDVVEMTVRARKSGGDYIWLFSRQMIYEKHHGNKSCTIIREVEDVTKLMELHDELQEKVEQLKDVSYKNSHLLRSPVASIIGLVGLIEDNEITSEHNRQIFHFLKEAIQKLDNVVHEINEGARLDR